VWTFDDAPQITSGTCEISRTWQTTTSELVPQETHTYVSSMQ
jgi:hypothetical protein